MKKSRKKIEWQLQQKEVLDFMEKKDLIVFASAGSGKTTVMVERLVRYLLGGGDINKIVVLTFTNNSANDMKEKIINTLKEEIANTNDLELAARLRKQIFDIPQADIGTIDSFCNSIVQKYYETIGISPGLSVLSASEANTMLDEAITLEIKDRIEREDKDFSEISSAFYSGRNLDKIKDIVKEIYRKTSSYPYPKKEIEKIKNSCSLDVLETPAFRAYIKQKQDRALLWKEKVARTSALVTDKNPNSRINIKYKTLENILSKLAQEHKDVYFYTETVEESFVKMPKRLYAEACKNRVDRDAFNKIRTDIEKFVKGLAETFILKSGSDCLGEKGERISDVAKMEFSSRKVMLNLVDLTEKIIERFDLLKAEEGKMTFSDLEGFALGILSQEGPDGEYIKSKVAEEITAEKEHIFIDEYQDTNYLQEMILSRISNNNVFMVGDIKQSIYMFRNSEPDIMKQKKEFYTRNPKLGEAKMLNDNFRSHKDILEFVNEVFSPIMTENFGKVAYRSEAKLTPPKISGKKSNEFLNEGEQIVEEEFVKKREDTPSVTVKMFFKESSNTKEGLEAELCEWETFGSSYAISNSPMLNAKIDEEAEWIANAILTMVGNDEIYDVKKKEFRKVSFEDIVILQRNRKTQSYTSLFAQRGIPLEVVGGDDALFVDDINVLNSVLKVISNPRQDYPLVLVLTSFFGQLTMEDLLSIRKKRKVDSQIDSLKSQGNVSRDANENIISDVKGESLYDAIMCLRGGVGDKCRQVLAVIDKYRQHAHVMDVPSLLNKIVSETGFDAEMLASPEERISSYNIYIEYLRGKEFSHNIDSYLKWLGKETKIDVKLPGSSENCVRMNTIHGSKGLEYPIVFFANSEQGYKKTGDSSGSDDIAFDKELGIASKYVDIKGRKLIPTISYQAIVEKQEEREKEEQMRLLYVVLTRAKNRLFITGTGVKEGVEDVFVSEIKTLSKLIEYASNESEIVRNAYNNYEPKEGRGEEAKVIKPLILPTDDILNFHSYKDHSSTKVHNKYAVTKMPSLGMEATIENEEYSEAIPVLVAQIEEVGTTYHQILEQIDFSKRSLEEVSAQIDTIFLSGGIKTKVAREEINDCYVYEALNHEIFTSLENMEIVREKAFALYLPFNNFVTASEVNDKVIVQGIIDMLGIDGDEATIVDYKYSNASLSDIKVRYHDQMSLYSMAVETLLQKKVTRKAIYVIPRNIVIDF